MEIVTSLLRKFPRHIPDYPRPLAAAGGLRRLAPPAEARRMHPAHRAGLFFASCFYIIFIFAILLILFIGRRYFGVLTVSVWPMRGRRADGNGCCCVQIFYGILSLQIDRSLP